MKMCERLKKDELKCSRGICQGFLILLHIGHGNANGIKGWELLR